MRFFFISCSSFALFKNACRSWRFKYFLRPLPSIKAILHAENETIRSELFHDQPKSMTIQKIIGENGAQPTLCKGGGCPAAILTEGGDIFVQGYVPESAEQGQLNAPGGEAFVRMSRATFEKIARQVLAL